MVSSKVGNAAAKTTTKTTTTTPSTLSKKTLLFDDDDKNEERRGKNRKNDDGNNDRNGLLVIGAGYGRTGTSSLQEALSILGFGPVYHMREVFKNDGHVHKWNNNVVKFKLENKEDKDKDDATSTIPKHVWDDLFLGYNSTMDFPASAYWEDLYKVYPNAKIILSIRDTSEKWYQSVLQTISPPTFLWRTLYKLTGLYDYNFSYMTYHTVWKTIYDMGIMSTNNEKVGDFNIDMVRTHPQLMKDGYTNHNSNVINKVPPENLLIFNVKDGWKPLCDFLNCDIPTKTTTTKRVTKKKKETKETNETKEEDNEEEEEIIVEMEFPHINDSKQFAIMVQRRRTKCMTRLAGGMGVAAVVVGVAAFIITRKKK